MTTGEPIAEGVFLVGGPKISCEEDAASYLIDFNNEAVLIDCGAGRSLKRILANIEEAGVNPRMLSALILTHCHIDHIGAAPELRGKTGCKILIHALDAKAFEEGDPVRTAANWYGATFPPASVDVRLAGGEGELVFGSDRLHWLHTPGHTPGSIVLWLDRNGQRILFGQDLHGPFSVDFESDVGQWRESMEKVLALRSDILCEGHFGIFRPDSGVRRYITDLIRQHENGL